jgi:hypothetical protein
MRRAARYDGWLPNYLPRDGSPATLTPEVLRDAVAWIGRERGENPAPYDVIVEGSTFQQDARTAARVTDEWAGAGATWWIEANWEFEGPIQQYASARLAAGPPR